MRSKRGKKICSVLTTRIAFHARKVSVHQLYAYCTQCHQLRIFNLWYIYSRALRQGQYVTVTHRPFFTLVMGPHNTMHTLSQLLNYREF